MKIWIFSTYLIIRVLLVIGTALSFGYIFWNKDWVFSQIVLLAVLLLMTFELIYYVRKTERELQRFLEILKYKDYNRTLDHRKQHSELVKTMQDIKHEYEEDYQEIVHKEQWMDVALNVNDFGILVANHNDEVIFQNIAFSGLMNISNVSHLKQLFNQVPRIQENIKNIRSEGEFVLLPSESDYNFVDALRVHYRQISLASAKFSMFLITKDELNKNAIDFDAWINFGKVISHEINNGITPIQSLAESIVQLLERESPEAAKEKIEKACQIIQEQCRALTTFNEKYRQLVKTPSPQLAPTDLITLVESSIKKYATDPVKVHFRPIDHPAIIQADSDQISQVLSNLFLNSISAMAQSDEKEISIEIKENKENYTLHFSDSGTGIPEDLRASIFIPYFSTKETGSGIGLSLSRQILHKHGARIQLEDSTSGATFALVFPKRFFS